MNIVDPKEVAKWFMQKGLDNPSNTNKGNMKLQKLLFFSQLIFMCRNNGNTMYDEKFSAFENGMVLEPIRQTYRNNYYELQNEANKKIQIPPKVEETLIITNDIFGQCSADELSELSHQFEAWSKYLKQSIDSDNYHNKEKAIVPYEELEKELYKMNKVLQAYEQRDLYSEDDDF